MSDSDDGQWADQDDIDDCFVTAATTTTTTATTSSTGAVNTPDQVPPILDENEKFLRAELDSGRSPEEVMQRLYELDILEELRAKGYLAGVEVEWLAAEDLQEEVVEAPGQEEAEVRIEGEPAVTYRRTTSDDVRRLWEKHIAGRSEEELYLLGAAASLDTLRTIGENYPFWIGSYPGERVPPVAVITAEFPRVMREAISAALGQPRRNANEDALRDQLRRRIAEHSLPVPQNYAEAAKAVDISLDSHEVMRTIDDNEYSTLVLMLGKMKTADIRLVHTSDRVLTIALMFNMATKFGYYVGTLDERRAKLRTALRGHPLFPNVT